MASRTSLLIAAMTAATLVSHASSFADTLRVRSDAPPGGDGSTWATAFHDLQMAIASAVGPTEIWVAAGLYTPGTGADEGATFELRSDLALYGGFAGNETSRSQRDPTVNITILSGDLNQDDIYGSPVWHIGWNINTPNADHVVTAANADATAVLDGFTITAGHGSFTGGAGITIENASPSVSNCTFLRNLAGFSSGGAASITDGQPTFTDCTFLQNWVHLGHGGAIQTWNAGGADVVSCTFQENQCTGDTPEAAGGAISHQGSSPLNVLDSAFTSNVAKGFFASGSTAGGYGGAIFHFISGPMTVDRCTFIANFSNAGGAVFTFGSPTITNSLFRNNQAPEYQASQGGWGGYGGAIGAISFAGSTVHVINCTVVNNTSKRGGGIRFQLEADSDIVSCILWANSDEFGQIGPSQIDGARASFSCIQNMLIGQPGEDPPDPAHFPNCISDDPLFVNLPGGDAHLTNPSPAIDAGSNGAIPAGMTLDLDHTQRIVDGPAPGGLVVDMGAFEFHLPPPLCPADIVSSATFQPPPDGLVNGADLAYLLGEWGANAGSAADIVTSATFQPPPDGVVDGADLAYLLGAWGTCK